MLTEQFLPGIVDGVVRASLLVHNDCHSLYPLKMLRVNIHMLEGVLSKRSKCWSNFVVQLPGLPSRVFTLSNECRSSIATAKCVKHRKTSCFGLSKGSAYSVDADESEVFSHSKGNTNVCIRSLCDQSAKLSHQDNNNVSVLEPDCRACNTWITILVSASSWLHGGMGVAADPHDVTGCPESANIIKGHLKA